MFGSTFGQKPATTTAATFASNMSQPTFGSPSGSAFGTPQQAAFGTPQQAAFGTPQQAAFGQPSSALSFGQTTNAPAFGQTAAPPTFGQASTTPAFGQTPSSLPSFGVTTTPGFGSTAPGFGSPAPLNFGANQLPKTGFGTPTTTTQPSLSFGTGTTPTTTQQPSGFAFGTNLGQSSFGATATTITSSTPSVAGTPQPSLTFSSTPQTSTSLSFGTTKPTFGATTTTTQSSLTFGSTLVSKPTTVPSSIGFNFGTTPTTASAIGVVTTSQTLVAGLSSYTTAGLSLGTAAGRKSMLTITGNTATPLYSTKTSDLQAGRSPGQLPPKCQTIHPLVQELVESFKNHMKDQKHLCLEVSRASLKPISKISNDAENIKKSVMKLERAVNKNKLLNTKLKDETIKALADAEVAQKAMDYPGGFPCDNSIITDYFLQLANKFQQQVVSLRVELESTEKSILCELNPVAFTPQELSTTMQRLYECFVALAGRFQFVHAQISNLKVQHLQLRKKKLEDYTDIFSKKNITPSIKPSSPVAKAPTLSLSLPGFQLNTLVNRTKQINESLPTAFTPAPPGNPIFASPMNQTAQNNNLLSSSPPSSAPGTKRGKR